MVARLFLLGIIIGVCLGAYSFNLKVRNGVNAAAKTVIHWLATHNTAYYEKRNAAAKAKVKKG